MSGVETIARAIGATQWTGDILQVERCPLCASRWTFRFLGSSGFWECVSCHPEAAEYSEMLADHRLPHTIRDRIAIMGGPQPPEGLLVVSEYIPPSEKPDSISTGFRALDKETGGFEEAGLTVLTGKRSEGKSTISGLFALSAINEGRSVCFYSGELNALRFRSWIYQQAAGPAYLIPSTDGLGAVHYDLDEAAEARITSWLGSKLILYDNTCVKSSARNTILERFEKAAQHYGSSLFVIDNLMTARIPLDSDRDFYRAQSNFVGDLVDFAHRHKAHVLLCAHPRKDSDGDPNDAVAGSSGITDRASNVLRIRKANHDGSDSRRDPDDVDAVLMLTKNRAFGNTCKLLLRFDQPSKRFMPLAGGHISRYGWEDLF